MYIYIFIYVVYTCMHIYIWQFLICRFAREKVIGGSPDSWATFLGPKGPLKGWGPKGPSKGWGPKGFFKGWSPKGPLKGWGPRGPFKGWGPKGRLKGWGPKGL